ncbi:MAG: nucleotidyltransferase domain-containing protein, partial [Oscillospiraceae bacterium]|nr:nucleotidyltransferase domain-containing protein [Oscillospiraceae bacterium]
MVDITAWMEIFLQALERTFGNRIWFVGLQGSYARGEQTPQSDIDVVVILDELTSADITAYHTMLEEMPNREKICGFVSGRQELAHWDTADLFQFCHDTEAVKGSLETVA